MRSHAAHSRPGRSTGAAAAGAAAPMLVLVLIALAGVLAAPSARAASPGAPAGHLSPLIEAPAAPAHAHQARLAQAQIPSQTPAPDAPAPNAVPPDPQAPPSVPPADGLTPPPVLDPKSVETRPVIPGGGPVAVEGVLVPVPVLGLSGTAKWEDAYDVLVAAAKSLEAELARLGLKRAGDVLVGYTASDDAGFDYEVQIPFSGTTVQKPSGAMKLGGSHAGKILRFTHSGSFADMDNTYEMIANYLDEKSITAEELYIEQYRSDLATAAPDALEIDILVPVP